MNKPVWVRYNHDAKEWEALVYIEDKICLMGSYTDINEAVDTVERLKAYFEQEGV